MTGINLSNAGWDVYVGVLPRLGELGCSESVCYAPWLYTDVDGGEEGPQGAIELVKKADLLPCHMAVMSGNGVHLYWRVKPIMSFGSHEDRRAFSGLLKRMVLTIGGTAPAAHADDSCTDLARILRLPGTVNYKREPKQVKLVRCLPDAPIYPIEAWNALLHPLPNPKPISTNGLHWEFKGEVPEGIRRWSEAPFPEGKRHKDLTSAGAWLYRDLSIPKNLVEDLLLAKARASSGTRVIDEDEVRSIVKWL